MSTFVQRLWDRARNRERGFDKNIAVVNRADLIQLLENFERLDNEARERHAVSEMQYQQLKQASELQIKIPSYTLDDIRSLSEIRNRPQGCAAGTRQPQNMAKLGERNRRGPENSAGQLGAVFD